MSNRPDFFTFTVTLLFSLLTALGQFTDVASSPRFNPGDWPQWRGPNRDGISPEKGILKSWPAKGPKVIWEKSLGSGFSAVSIVGDQAFTMYSDDKDEYAVCLDATTGAELWRFKTDRNYVERAGGDGPRATPVIDGGIVYLMSAYGKLYALEASSGKAVWQHDLQREYGGKMPIWGISTTPLVDGDLLYVDVGGRKDFALMAFDKKTGKTRWNAYSGKPGYSAPIAANLAGVRQILFFTGTHLVSAAPQDGTIFWDFPWQTEYDVNAATPIVLPNDRVFISSGYGTGAAVLQVNATNGKPTVKTVWRNTKMKNRMSSSIFHNGFIYGFDMSTIKCIDAATGDEQWAARGLGEGTLMLADDHLIILSERGKLVLAKAIPESLQEIASAEVLRGKCWTMPSLANGRLYLRNERQLMCLDFREVKK